MTTKNERIAYGKEFENSILTNLNIHLKSRRWYAQSLEQNLSASLTDFDKSKLILTDSIKGDILIFNLNHKPICGIDAKAGYKISINSLLNFKGIINSHRARAIYCLRNGIIENNNQLKNWFINQLEQRYNYKHDYSLNEAQQRLRILNSLNNFYKDGDTLLTPMSGLLRGKTEFGIDHNIIPKDFYLSKSSYLAEDYYNTILEYLKY